MACPRAARIRLARYDDPTHTALETPRFLSHPRSERQRDRAPGLPSRTRSVGRARETWLDRSLTRYPRTPCGRAAAQPHRKEPSSLALALGWHLDEAQKSGEGQTDGLRPPAGLEIEDPDPLGWRSFHGKGDEEPSKRGLVLSACGREVPPPGRLRLESILWLATRKGERGGEELALQGVASQAMRSASSGLCGSRENRGEENKRSHARTSHRHSFLQEPQQHRTS